MLLEGYHFSGPPISSDGALWISLAVQFLRQGDTSLHALTFRVLGQAGKDDDQHYDDHQSDDPEQEGFGPQPLLPG